MAKLESIEVEQQLHDAVTIDPLRLSDEYTCVAAHLAYWNERFREANEAYLETKYDLKRTTAHAYLFYRAELEEGGEKFTDSRLSALVEVDSKVITAGDKHLRAEIVKGRISGILDAVRAKKEMLISLGAHVRAELGGDPAMRRMHQEANQGRVDPFRGR